VTENLVCRWNFDDSCYSVGDISTSGLGGHIAISGSPSSSKSLPLKSPWSILSVSQLKRNTFGTVF